ncbi:MAG: pseudouridine synthase [bacterium]
MQMRIHKFMSLAGVASRRTSEQMVVDKKVLINGHPAKIGDIVDPEHDKIIVNGKLLVAPSEFSYFLVHKPRQVVSTVSDPDGRRTVTSLVPGGTRLYPVGRLDYESEGLMLLTNDGELAHHLTHPSFEIDKTYRVLVKGVLPDKSVGYLEAGLTIEGHKTAPAKVNIVERQEHNTWFDITIHEGRNRQIRKMCEAIGYPCLRLIRTRLGPWELGDLASGQTRQIAVADVNC